MPVEIARRPGLEIADAKEFSMPGRIGIENTTPRPACTAPTCRGCKRPCARGIGEGLPPIKKVPAKK